MTDRREQLATNLQAVQDEISSYSPTLIVVTKTYPISDVEILHDLGVGEFGENRSDEGALKQKIIPARWHYQGAIQGKKLREILSWSDCIHSLDKFEHAEKIGRILQEGDSEIDLFLQLSLDGNPERGGVVLDDLFSLAAQVTGIEGIRILGIMSVPPVEMKPEDAFAEIARSHQRFKAEYPNSPFLSAGMSGDYLIALEHGATHIRVGSKILGSRQYD